MGADKNQCTKETGEWTWDHGGSLLRELGYPGGTAGRPESRGLRVSEVGPDALEGSLLTGTTWVQITSSFGTGVRPALLRMDEDFRRTQPPGESFRP